jgi:hypothetical protein
MEYAQEWYREQVARGHVLNQSGESFLPPRGDPVLLPKFLHLQVSRYMHSCVPPHAATP